MRIVYFYRVIKSRWQSMGLMVRSVTSCLLFLCMSVGFALDVSIETDTSGDKHQYYVLTEPFKQAQTAEILEKRLSKIANAGLHVKKDNAHEGYRLQIGPLNDYATALNIKKQIHTATTTNQLQSTTLLPAKKVWNLRDADIRAVISEIARTTGKNFIIDPRVQGKISIISSMPMDDKEIYQVFLSMLRVSGYAAIPSGKIIKIVPNIEARTQASDILSQMQSPPKGDAMMVRVIPVRYVPAEQLVPILRPLMPQWNNVSAYGPSNMLILSGHADNIKQLTQIIQQVDTSSANDIDVVSLHHALAMDIANTLKDLVKVQSYPNRQPTTIAADDRNNAILISGNRTERLRLRLLINQLDKPAPHGQNGNTQVVYLNYLRAQDLVPILAGIAQASFSGTVGTTIGTITRPALDSTNPASSIVNEQTQSSEEGGAGHSEATPNTTETTSKTEGDSKPTVQIIAEPNTNAIIINAPATIIRMLKSVISQLDIKPAQILIEAMVAEVNESDVKDLGVEWGSINQDNLSSSSFAPGFAVLNSQTTLAQFQAQIYALEKIRKANILSTPSVVVLDNRQAKILIGKQVSVATSSYPNNAGGTTTASPFTTFDRVNVALHLYVRPQITRGKGIQLQIDQGNNTLDPSSSLEDSTIPVFNISAIVTSVHIDSGDIVVLGGLIQDSLGNDDNRIPILGDIPGIGRLFQRNITNREKKVLMVFIRPTILRSQVDSLQVTGTKYNNLRDEQLQFLRAQETYNKQDKAIVLPPMHEAKLPRPFASLSQKSIIIDKSRPLDK